MHLCQKSLYVVAHTTFLLRISTEREERKESAAVATCCVSSKVRLLWWLQLLVPSRLRRREIIHVSNSRNFHDYRLMLGTELPRGVPDNQNLLCSRCVCVVVFHWPLQSSPPANRSLRSKPSTIWLITNRRQRSSFSTPSFFAPVAGSTCLQTVQATVVYRYRDVLFKWSEDVGTWILDFKGVGSMHNEHIPCHRLV